MRNYQTIPNDWNGQDWQMWVICVPKSQGWRIAFRNAVRTLTRGRYWDRDTGTITDTQKIGLEVYDSMGTCDGIETLLERIAVAVEALQGQQAQMEVCCNASQVDNAVQEEIRPLEQPVTDNAVDPPPAGYTDWDEFNCKAAHALVDEYAARLYALADLAENGASTALGVINELSYGHTLVGEVGGAILLVVGYLVTFAAKVWQWIGEEVGAPAIRDYGDALMEDGAFRDGLLCAWVSGATWEERSGAMNALFDNEFGTAVGYIMSILVPSELLQSLYNGYYTDVDGVEIAFDLSDYAGVVCDCTEPTAWGMVGATTGYCQESVIDFSANTTHTAAFTATVSKTSGSGSYQCSVERTWSMIEDGDGFSFLWSGNKGASLQIRDSQSAILYSTDISTGATGTVDMTQYQDATFIRIHFDGESYTEACPQVFSGTMSLTY